MGFQANSYIWKDESKQDIKTTEFLELLLKYSYVWYKNDKEMKLNLTETDKTLFLKECSESIENIDEMRASKLIEVIRHKFKEELSRLKKDLKNTDEQTPPWFFKAYKLFQQSSISEASSISGSSTPAVIDSSSYPTNDPTLEIMEASATLSLTPTVEPFAWNMVLPNLELPLLNQEKQLANPPSLPLKNVYDNENLIGNVIPQYFPIIYPVCILPCFSLGLSSEASVSSCSKNKRESLYGNEILGNRSSSTHPQISDFSYLSGDSGILDSYPPESRYFQTNQERNFSEPSTSINPIETISANFTDNNSLDKKYFNSTNGCSSHMPFKYSLTKTSTVFSGTISSNSSGSRTRFSPLPRGKLKNRNRTSPTAKTKSSILLPPRNSLIPHVTDSISSFATISSSTLINSVTIPSFPRASASPASRSSVPQAFRSSVAHAPRSSVPHAPRYSVPHASRVSISQADRDHTLPISTNSMSREVNCSHQLVAGSELQSSASYEGMVLSSNAINYAIQTVQLLDLSV